MHLLTRVILNAVISFGVALGVLYWAPGPAPSPEEIRRAINANATVLESVVTHLNQKAKKK
jgi:hypothetical protein